MHQQDMHTPCKTYPNPQGMYICSGSNKAGSVTASAMLRVQEPPVISVKPVAHYQVFKSVFDISFQNPAQSRVALQ